VKGNQTCIYADPSRQETVPGTENKPVATPVAELQRSPVTHWPTSPENIRRHSQAVSDIGLAPSNSTPDVDNQLRISGANPPNDYVLNLASNMSAEVMNPQVMSPEMSTYAATQFSLGSNDSIVPRSAGSQPTFNVAISRWFDMLVGDATFENSSIPDFDIGLNEHGIVGTPKDPDLNGIPYMGRTCTTPGGADISVASPSSSSPQLLERSAPGPDRNAMTEKMRWQSPDNIPLLPYEHLIFRNFVQRISLWVTAFYLLPNMC
jgi:hypothetical protein